MINRTGGNRFNFMPNTFIYIAADISSEVSHVLE